MKNIGLQVMIGFFCMVPLFAFADASCQAETLNGQWTCDNGQSLVFDVSVKNDIYQLNPTESVGVLVQLDGQPHDVAEGSISAKGTCEGPVVDLDLTMGPMTVSQKITIQSPRVFSVDALAQDKSYHTSCRKVVGDYF